MTILYLEKTKNYIVDWIKNYANTNGIKSLIVGLSGGVDSALVALLCQRTGLPTVCVNMPCHSSPSSHDRAKNFAEENGLNFVVVDLSLAHESIYNQVKESNKVEELGLNNPVAVGGLRSCLRAPTLSYFALANKGIIVGTGNRSEDNLIRYFQKYGDGCVDISPISDLFKSEVYELFAYMTGIKVNSFTGPPAAVQIYIATPTADLWGPDGNHTDEEELGISYDEIEWADRENDRTTNNGRVGDRSYVMSPGIISKNSDPTKHRSWPAYTQRQREVIAKMHQMEKMSRHKYNSNLPICKVRDVEGLVR